MTWFRTMDGIPEYLDWNCYHLLESSNISTYLNSNLSNFCAFELEQLSYEEQDINEIPKIFKWIYLSLYVILFLYSVFGNAMVCLSFRKGIIERTKANFFIVVMSVNDIVFILCELYLVVGNVFLFSWPYLSVMCPVIVYSLYLTINFRAFVLVTLTFTKYLAILRPIKEIHHKTDCTSKLMVVVSSVTSILISLPAALYARVSTMPHDEGDEGICLEVWDDLQARNIYGVFKAVMQYCLPIALMAVTYTHIIVILHRHRIPGEPNMERDARVLKQKKKVLFILFLFAFLGHMIWYPDGILNVM